MRTFLLINDSEHASLNASQRILAKYLPQVGRATYLGSLSEEGLQDLKEELQAKRSRYMSVACFQVATNHAHDLRWVIGRKAGWDIESGRYAFRYRETAPKLTSQESPELFKILTSLLKLGALTHDIGKAGDAFQDKLRRACETPASPRPEFFRHDGLSYWVLRQISAKTGHPLNEMARLATMTSADLSSRLLPSSATPDNLRSIFADALSTDILELETALQGAPGRLGRGRREKLLTPEQLETCCSIIVRFLALSHHSLPAARVQCASYKDSKAPGALTSGYFNEGPDAASTFKACVTFSRGGLMADATGATTNVGRSFIEELSRLAELLKKVDCSTFDLGGLCHLALTYARPVLVLSDHLGSALKRDRKAPGDHLLWANTRQLDGGVLVGDSLHSHVQNVVGHARRQCQLFFHLANNDRGLFPSLSSQAIRQTAALRLPSGPFSWQRKAYEFLNTLPKTANGGTPTFGLVTAATGSGKTVGAAQPALALGSKRFTYCLGLRTLTLQTGQSYRKDLKLSPMDLATVIGDASAQKAFEGAESIQQDGYLTDGATQTAEWLAYARDTRSYVPVEEAFPERTKDFISVPISVCTIDQLIGVTNLSVLSKARAYLRLYSADIVLDEVDNYSPSELPYLQRLCYLAGLARKHVICMSATLSPILSMALFREYRAGLQANQRLTGLSADTQLVQISNTGEPACLAMPAGLSETPAAEAIRMFNNASMAHQSGLPSKVRAQVLNATVTQFSRLKDELFQLHAHNHGIVDGVKVSVGFARFSQIQSTQSFARYLMEAEMPEDTEMAVICYHSKASALELSAVNEALNTLTNRKGLPIGAVLSDTAVSRFVTPLRQRVPHCGNLLLVVVTSEVLETGRDHDYDWGLVEPSSHRSLIQCAGRILRHRYGERLGEACNLSVIQTPLRALNPGDPLRVWAYPGPLTHLEADDRDLGYSRLVTKAAAALRNSRVLPLPFDKACSADAIVTPEYLVGVRNTITLAQPEAIQNAAALLEQYVLHQKTDAERHVRENHQHLTGWAYQRSFRGYQGKGTPLTVLHLKAWLSGKSAVDSVSLTPLTADGQTSYVQPISLGLKHVHRALLLLPQLAGTAERGLTPERLITKVLGHELDRLQALGLTRRELIVLSEYVPSKYSEADPECWHHPLLGFNHKPVYEGAT